MPKQNKNKSEADLNPTQKNITKFLKRREKLQKAIDEKQRDLAAVNLQISKFADWMKGLAATEQPKT